MSNIIKAGQTSEMEFKLFSPSNFLKSGPLPKVRAETPFFKPLESGGEKDLNGERNSKEKIDSFIKEAEERTAVIKEKAYREGFNQGKIDGSEETAKRLESIADNLTRLLSDMDCSKEEMLKGEEQYIKELVMTIAQKVILHEISINKDAIKKAVKETLKYVSDKGLVHIKVNPEDLEHLATYKQDFSSCVKDLKNLDLIGDEEISPGGFFIETGFETIDGRMEQKLDMISKIVEEELSKS